MPLQNRVLPNADIVAEPWRGTFMGNRGGRIHDPETRTLTRRRWSSKRWIICVCDFKNRHREVMGNSYTELFFLDEVSALATGHRPCFECRRQAANRFCELWQEMHGTLNGSKADAMDEQLHQERTSQSEPLRIGKFASLPDGAMIEAEGTAYAIKNTKCHRWSGNGYGAASDFPEKGKVLTPPSILSVLSAGYEPIWHDSILRGDHGTA